jgi:polyferredoxin
MGYPQGLIRYTTQNELELGKPRKLLRPRVLVYSGLLAAIAVALLVAVLLRTPLGLDVLRDRASLFRETPEGLIENVYVLKVMNMDSEPHRYRVSATGIEGVRVRVNNTVVQAASGAVIEVPVSLLASPDVLRKGSQPVRFVLEAEDNPKLRAEAETRFMGPR